jgi:hypothetical protein
MVLTGLTESGAEEWLCPACQRRLLLRWRPHFQTLVLEHGDTSAVHAGSKGGIKPHAESAAAAASPGPSAGEQHPSAGEQHPSAGEQEWLRSNGIDWDGCAS